METAIDMVNITTNREAIEYYVLQGGSFSPLAELSVHLECLTDDHINQLTDTVQYEVVYK